MSTKKKRPAQALHKSQKNRKVSQDELRHEGDSHHFKGRAK